MDQAALTNQLAVIANQLLSSARQADKAIGELTEKFASMQQRIAALEAQLGAVVVVPAGVMSTAVAEPLSATAVVAEVDGVSASARASALAVK